MDEHKTMPPLLCRLLLLVVAVLSGAAPPCAASSDHPSVPLLVTAPAGPIVLHDHRGALLTGNLTVNILYYGRFAPAQRAIVAGFVQSVTAAPRPPPPRPRVAGPSVSSWWRTVSLYRGGGARLRLGRQFQDQRMSFGRSLSLENVTALARRVGHHHGAITVVLTGPDVAVASFCVSRCGAHDHATGGAHGRARYAYLWAGNPAQQCPGQCAWPFHQPLQGPQTPPLVPPNGDAGVDGMVISLATLLVGTVTNPYGDGYYQGETGAGPEAATACAGVFGSGAYPGYPGKLLQDQATGASYNAVGLGRKKYLLPALWDPTTSQCKTLV